MSFCKKWNIDPYRDPETDETIQENGKRFKQLLKACKSEKLSKENCKFLNTTAINPITGRKLERSGTRYKSLKKKCDILEYMDDVCPAWKLEREKNEPRNPRTNRKISPTGKVFRDLDKQCNIKTKPFKETQWWNNIKDFSGNVEFSKVKDNEFYKKFKDELEHPHSTMFVVHSFYQLLEIFQKENHEIEDEFDKCSRIRDLLKFLQYIEMILKNETYFDTGFSYGNLIPYKRNEYGFIEVIPEQLDTTRRIYIHLLRDLISMFKTIQLEKQNKMLAMYMDKISNEEFDNLEELEQEHEMFYESFFKKGKVDYELKMNCENFNKIIV